MGDQSHEDEPTRAETRLEGWDEMAGDVDQWRAGQQLGPYRLKRMLGQGGMGSVWLADQLEPFQREVAIKVQLHKLQNRLAEARFEVERQAMAQLSHRAVAQIHDAGKLPDGGLFFAMEYVPGQVLDHYLHEHAMTARDLARLFIEICSGIQHAHQRGLIHRDIKPQNILVIEVDGQPQPKIIDFGIAVSSTADTGAAQERVGTRAYMSPEQLAPDSIGVDARTDVYALGVVLGQAGATIALPRELRAIVLKAMDKDRECRYQSVEELAEDLRGWLRGEPVRAVQGGHAYRFGCFIRRHAVATAAASLVAAALLVGVVLALYGLREAQEERFQAETARSLAEQRRRDAEALIEFMLGDFATSLRPIGRLDLLDDIGSEALRYLAATEAGTDKASALNRARALRTLGEVQSQRQQFDLAAETLARAALVLAPWRDDIRQETAEMQYESGQIAFWQGSISYRQRDWETTEQHWQDYLHHSEAFAQVTDDAHEGREQLAYAHHNLGVLAEARNELQDALTWFLSTAATRRQLTVKEDIDSYLRLANTLSWTSRVQTALGQVLESRRSSAEALDLVLALEEYAPDHARRRQLETNFRFILAHQALQLEQHDQAAEQLRAALDLAVNDVANDPTQPRRQAQLARIAFFLAKTPGIARGESENAFDLGRQALDEATALGLDPQQTIELPGLKKLASLSLQPASDATEPLSELKPLIDALQARTEFDAHYFMLLEIAIAQARLAANAISTETLLQLQHLIDRIPDDQRLNLRFQLSQMGLWQLQSIDTAESRRLADRINQLRLAARQEFDPGQEPPPPTTTTRTTRS